MTCSGINHHDSIQAHTSDSFPLLSASVNRTASSSLVGKYNMLHPFPCFLNLLTCVLDHPTAALEHSSCNISDSGHPSPVLSFFNLHLTLYCTEYISLLLPPPSPPEVVAVWGCIPWCLPGPGGLVGRSQGHGLDVNISVPLKIHSSAGSCFLAAGTDLKAGLISAAPMAPRRWAEAGATRTLMWARVNEQKLECWFAVV